MLHEGAERGQVFIVLGEYPDASDVHRASITREAFFSLHVQLNVLSFSRGSTRKMAPNVTGI